MTTAELLVTHSGPIYLDDGDLIEPRRHKIRQNAVSVNLWCDVVDVTPTVAPPDRHRRYAPGDRHASLTVPVPVFLAYAWLRVRNWIG